MRQNRGHGSRGVNLFGRSPTTAGEPLLPAAQTPAGTYNRLSDASNASSSTSMPLSRPGMTNSSSGGFSSATSPRYGPTASIASPHSSNSRLGSSDSHIPLRSAPDGIISRPSASLTSGTLGKAGAIGSSVGMATHGKSGKSIGVGMMNDDDLDDQLHTFTAKDRKDLNSPFTLASWRGWTNGLTLFFLLTVLVVLFAGYPIINWAYDNDLSSGSSTSGYNLGGVNSSGQYPSISGFPTLIDADTPSSVYTRTGFDGNTWTLVFSDEFNKEGRTFYNGDDPYFEAVDLNYWPTGDFEWYDPSAITTKDGHLVITMTQEPIHNLNFKSGMLQSWNKLCFNKNAYFEVSASLPGVSTVGGFWPGIWTMGNLGRPGYGATTDGMWPYTYDSCDVGILPNQTWLNGTGPEAALTTGSDGGVLSYLPGQRASACTCPGQPHPGPNNNVGRGAVEIDMLEAQILISEGVGQVSQSAQVAPYDASYQFNNASGTTEQYNTEITSWNTYLGGHYQQAVSSLTMVDDSVYYGSNSGQFAVFGFEYSSDSSDRSNGYITWVSQGEKSWTMKGTAVGPDTATGVGQRLIAEEPMALIFNFGMSENFQTVDFEHLTFPNYLRIDYIRVWQLSTGTIGCDPEDHPTASYIAQYANAYADANLTTWASAGYTFPNNTLQGC